MGTLIVLAIIVIGFVVWAIVVGGAAAHADKQAKK